jgi:hypothetical protein
MMKIPLNTNIMYGRSVKIRGSDVLAAGWFFG